MRLIAEKFASALLHIAYGWWLLVLVVMYVVLLPIMLLSGNVEAVIDEVEGE